MPSLLIAVPLLVLTLALSGPTLAGPPEGVSGKMVMARDEVADELRKYRQEILPTARLRWLKKHASTKDPRVALAIGEATTDPDPTLSLWSRILLFNNVIDSPKPSMTLGELAVWWKENGADLRRRAKQLPQ
jgi:hypothetical protein